MPYFKNSELAYTYHVSDRTVRNWVALAREGKLPLELEMIGDKAYVAKTSGNIKIIEEYVARNKTKRPRNALKVISPSSKFYKLFTPAQIYDIVRNLEMHHEIPRQYNYFDGGAGEWDEYIKQLADEKTKHIFTETLTLLEETEPYLKSRLAKYDKINVIDVGVGNGLQAIDLLKFLIKEQKLGRYIAIDISPEMLDIAEQNVHAAINEKIIVEKYEMDVTHERFANILAESYLRKGSNKSANIVLLLGATPTNLRNPDDMFRTVRESMSSQDFLIYTGKLETEDSRPEWLKHDAKPGKMTLSNRHKLVFDLLNIDESFYDVEVGFDEKSRQQYTRTRLRVAITLCFEFEEGERTIQFEKGDTILLWRAWQVKAHDVTEQLTRTDFNLLYSIQSENREYILTVSQAKFQK